LRYCFLGINTACVLVAGYDSVAERLTEHENDRAIAMCSHDDLEHWAEQRELALLKDH
jgi:hypothetical protein